MATSSSKLELNEAAKVLRLTENTIRNLKNMGIIVAQSTGEWPQSVRVSIQLIREFEADMQVQYPELNKP